jgi:nucleoside-diphosphate-sugar epimerase
VLVPILLGRGYTVRVLNRLLFGLEPLGAVSTNTTFELIPGDVRDIQTVFTAMKGCDAVIDLASIVGDSACAIDTQLSVEVNCGATRLFIDIFKARAATVSFRIHMQCIWRCLGSLSE